MLPVLISQLVVVLKDSAIGYQITFLEMVRQGTQWARPSAIYIPALIVIALLMISVNFALSSFATWLERRLRRSRRGPSRWTRTCPSRRVRSAPVPAARFEPWCRPVRAQYMVRVRQCLASGLAVVGVSALVVSSAESTPLPRAEHHDLALTAQVNRCRLRVGTDSLGSHCAAGTAR